MSNLSAIINDNQKNLKGASFHFISYGIILVLGALACIVGGVIYTIYAATLISILKGPAVLSILPMIIYGLIAAVYIYLSIRLFKAFSAIGNINTQNELTQDSYNENSMKVILEFKKFFKILNIIFVTTTALLILGGIAIASALPMIMNKLNELDKNPNFGAGSSMMDGKYKNPYSGQGANPQSATQMGMSDEEHAMMHDPKNIVDTDYSKLDYSNSADEIKASQEAVKNAMEKMTPEQKAAMEKAMSNVKN